jgi:hypothetical protein
MNGALARNVDNAGSPGRLIEGWEPEHVRTFRTQCVDDYLDGRTEGESLTSARQDSVVVRLHPALGPSVILKLWRRPGVRGLLRRVSGTAPRQREAKALALLGSVGALVPTVLSHGRIERRESSWTDALLLEDLGSCVPALDFVKSLIQAGGSRKQQVDDFLDAVVDLTCLMVEHGILDVDHGFFNVVATPSGRVARLDLELAHIERPTSLSPRRYGLMLANLIGSFVFAVQPVVETAERFARVIERRLRPSPAALQVASAGVKAMMERQTRNHGPDTQIILPWEGR